MLPGSVSLPPGAGAARPERIMTDVPVDRPPRIYIDLIGDLFHAGHLRHLTKAKSLGGTLVVGVFDDASAERLSHIPVAPLEERLAVISALRCVDEVIPGVPTAPDLEFLDKYDIDSICLSDDFDDPDRQKALTTLLEDGTGIVLPYTEDITTADIAARITQTDIQPPAPSQDHSALVHAPVLASGSADGMVLDAIGAVAAGIFGREWMLARDRIGDDTWLTLLRGVANNQVQRGIHRTLDPRFLSAIVSLSSRFAEDGDRINLVGNAAEIVGAALAEQGFSVTILRPGIATTSDGPADASDVLNYVYCDVAGLPDASPPAEISAVLDTAWSALLLIDASLLFESTRRLTRDLILAIDFWPEDSGTFLPAERDGRLYFSDAFIRNVLHGQGFFDIEDILTTRDGAPLPEYSPGCARVSRTAMVEEDQADGCFRYLDGEKTLPVGTADSGQYVRWYRASKIAIAEDEA